MGASQMPFRNRAVFIVALDTGLRSFEIEGLEFSQYQTKYLKNVRGKGEHYQDVYLSTDARYALDEYIKKERDTNSGPLFLTNRGGRMFRQQVDRLLRRLAAHANAKLHIDENIHLHAHKLRHSGVKKVCDEHGELAAKRFSRHRGFAHLERYATQTRDGHESMVDNLWS
jgi:site-specific recombinase XerD